MEKEAKEPVEQTNQLPEAPASQTIKIAYKGAEILLTQRDLDVKMKPFLEQAKKVIDWAMENGFEAPKKGVGFPAKVVDYVEGRVCPKDGGKLVRGVTKTGKKNIKCENNKWNFTTKQSEGCPFIEWEMQPSMGLAKQITPNYAEYPERQINEDRPSEFTEDDL